MKLRGVLTVALVGLSLVTLDVVQRTVVTAAVLLRPRARHRILWRWQHFLAHLMMAICRLPGGARFEPLPRIPARPGVLVLMNHQSLLDIPVMVAALAGGYPRIVTRSRYARGVPLISHMVRLYQYPLVNPGATVRRHLEDLAETTRASPVPVGVFPEGHRTPDGSIGTFKKMGLRHVLGVRPWEVYVFVADGMWQTARLRDFLQSPASIHARYRVVGPFSWSGDADAADAFLDDVREIMRRSLAELRGEPLPADAEAVPLAGDGASRLGDERSTGRRGAAAPRSETSVQVPGDGRHRDRSDGTGPRPGEARPAPAGVVSGLPGDPSPGGAAGPSPRPPPGDRSRSGTARAGPRDRP